MKQYTTPDQTAKLAELGFNKPRECQTYTMRDDRGVEYGVLYGGYSIGELMAVLPENVAKENEMPSTLNISLMDGEWCVQYADFLGADFEFCNTELVNALYDMVVRLKERRII